MTISLLNANVSMSLSASTATRRTVLTSTPTEAEAPQTTADYLKRLQTLNPGLDITIGPNPRQGTQKNTVGISEKFLQKCLDDPELAARFEKNLAGQIDAIRQKDAWAMRDGVEIIGGGLRIDDDGGWSSGYGGMMVTRQSGGSGNSGLSSMTVQAKKNVDPVEQLATRRAERREREQKAVKARREKKERQEALSEQQAEAREAKRLEPREWLERPSSSGPVPRLAAGESFNYLA